MTLLAESDGGEVPKQKEEVYSRKLDLKSNQAPGHRDGQRLQQPGWDGSLARAVGGEASQEPRGGRQRPPLPSWGSQQALLHAVSPLQGKMKARGPAGSKGWRKDSATQLGEHGGERHLGSLVKSRELAGNSGG